MKFRGSTGGFKKDAINEIGLPQFIKHNCPLFEIIGQEHAFSAYPSFFFLSIKLTGM